MPKVMAAVSQPRGDFGRSGVRFWRDEAAVEALICPCSHLLFRFGGGRTAQVNAALATLNVGVW